MSNVTTTANEKTHCFDAFPPEVCERLAVHMLYDEPGTARRNGFTDHALDFAQSSPKQRRAVVSVLNHRLGLGDAKATGGFRRWAKVFENDIQELSLIPFPKEIPLCIHQLLISSTLRRAEIPNFPYALSAVSGSTSIRELKLWMKIPLMAKQFSQLSRTQLSKIFLVCAPAEDKYLRCFFYRKFFNSTRNALAAACPGVASLEMDCIRQNEVKAFHIKKLDALWHTVRSMPALREIRFDNLITWRGIPPDVFAKLRTLDSVKISDGRCLGCPLRIGRSVTELCTRAILNEEQIARLKELPQLTSLSLRCKEGSETALPSTIHFLPSLRDLKCQWEIRANVADGIFPYPTVVPRVLLRTVERCPSLKSLCLGDARIPVSELIDVLKHLGDRLESFLFPMLHQGGSAADRVEALMHAATKYNCNLREFANSDEIDEGLDEASPVPEVQKKRLWTALRLLESRAPFLGTPTGPSVLINAIVSLEGNE